MSQMTWGDAIDNSDAEHFVGRQQELSIFLTEIQRVTAPPPYKPKLIFFISGQGGVGKTELLKHYKEIAQEAKFIVADCNENQGNIPSILYRFASQIKERGKSLDKFLEKYSRYQQLKQEIESDPNAPLGLASFIGQSIAVVGLSLADEVPVLRQGTKIINRAAVTTQAGEGAKYIAQKWSNKHDEIALIKNPVPLLSTIFFRDLNEIADNCPVLLCFDNYEISRDYLDTWLNQIREYNPSINIRVAIACRTVPGIPWEGSSNVLKHIPLDVFSPEEALEFLDLQGITDEHRRNEILEFSGRLPVLMQWLSSPDAESPDPLLDTTDIVDRFLRWVKEPNRRVIALEASIPRFFNLDVLAIMFKEREIDDIDRDFEWLIRQPFIPTEHENGWKYHGVVRRIMLQYQKRPSNKRYSMIQKQLAEYYREKYEELSLGTIEFWSNEQAQNLKVEHIYHYLLEAPDAHWNDFLNEFILALKYSLELAQKIIVALCEPASLEQFDEQKSAALTFFSNQVVILSKEFRWEAIELYDFLGKSFPPDYIEANAHLYFLRAEALRTKKRDLDKALEYIEVSIQLDPNHFEAIAERGEILKQNNKHDEAIIEFDRALKINPHYHFAHERKGMVLHRLERYEEALDAFNKADQASEDCYVTLKFRGSCHLFLNHFDEAINDLSKVMKATPEDANALMVRAQAYYENNQYDLALGDLEVVGKLTKEYEHVRFKNIGLVLSAKKNFQAAAENYVEALQAEPNCLSCWNHLITTYQEFNPHECIPSLMSEDSFGEMEFTALVYARRGQAFAIHNYMDALIEFRKAFQLDNSILDSYDVSLNDLGLLLGRNGRYADAIECFNHRKKSDYVEKYNIAIAKALWMGVENAVDEIHEAEKALKELEGGEKPMIGIAKYGYAGIEAVKHNKARALSLLNEALDLNRTVYSFASKADPAWISFRSDPDFIEILSAFRIE